MTDVSNTDDTIDSRDVIARIEELGVLLDGGTFDEEDVYVVDIGDDLIDMDDEHGELEHLKAFAEEAEGYSPDWAHGVTLVSDDYFERYAEELAQDIGAISSQDRWPLDCIDWEKAASELKVDYTAIDFDGIDFWVRY